MLMLRDCIGSYLYTGTGAGSYLATYAGKPTSFKTAQVASIQGLGYNPSTSFCTTAQNVRGVCPAGKTATNPSATSSTQGKGKPLWGGKRSSRKKNPRSSVKRSTVKKQKHY